MGRGGNETIINQSLSRNEVVFNQESKLTALSKEQERQEKQGKTRIADAQVLQLNRFPYKYHELLRLEKYKSIDNCFWCDKQLDNHSQHQYVKDVNQEGYIDFMRDRDKRGSGSRLNQVPCCGECLIARYTQGEGSLEEWVNRLGDKFPNRERMEKELLDPRTCRDWFIYLKTYRNQTMHKQRMQRELQQKLIAEQQVSKKERTPPIRGKAKEHIQEFLLGEDGATECVWCREKLDAESLTLDHLVPRAAGGSHWVVNLVAACKDCNSQRQDLPAEYFLKISRKSNKMLIEERLQILQSDPRSKQKHWQKYSVDYDKKAQKIRKSPYLLLERVVEVNE